MSRYNEVGFAMIIKLFLALIIVFSLFNCSKNNYISGNGDAKTTKTIVIMPEQKCNKKEIGGILVGKKIFHPAHKECYYTF